ncbi:Hypothetical predicted protein [Octopus vulgaris]|uniref:Uncharacterized protein n=1 Tax=Octopus vulgaris TaxID=6645 RepID=A0AA36AU20_OCTVU|nr:Hypothetical predicted protein [Octopus vulgaris]
MVSSDDIFKTSQLLIIIFWIIFNSQVQCHKLPPDSSSELLPSYSLPSSLFTIFDKSKDDRTSGILMYFKDDASSVETSVNLFSSFTQAQTKSFLQQYQLEVLLSPSSSSYFQSSSSILLSSNNLQTNGPSISLASSLVTACLSISMFNSLTANIEDPNNLHSIGISQTEFVSEGDSSISDMFNPYFQPLDNFFPVSNSLLLDSTSQILKSILALENLNDSMALENFPVVKMKPLMKEQNINQSKFDSQIYTISTGVSSLNINSRLLNINTSYVYSFKQQPHTQINSDSPFDEMMSESQIFSSSFALKSSQPYISPIFQTTSKLLSETQTRSDFDLNAKQYFTQKNFYSLSTLKDLITKKSVSTETENLHGALIIYSTQQMLWANSKTESMSPYKYDQTKLFVLHPSQSQISQIDEIESLYPINKNQIFLYNDHFLGSFQSAISQSYLSPFKHFTTNERPFSDLKFSLSGNTFASVNDPASSTFRRPITNSLESNSLHQPKFIKLTISQLISAYFDESQIHFDSKELLYMATAAAISEIPQQQAKWLSNSFNFQKSFHNNLYQSIIPMSHFNDNQSLLPSLKSEIWDVSNEFWKSKLEPVIMKSPEANLFGSNSDNLVPTLRHRTTDIVNPTQSMLQYFLENLYTESMTIDEFDTKESPHLSNTEILEPSEAVSLVNAEDLLLRTLQNIFPSFVSLGKTNTDTSFTSSSEELFHLLNSGLSFHTQPSHSMELLQPSTHTYIPITDLSELSLASSQIQMPLSFQSPVNFDLMNKFSSPNMIFYSDSEQILQTSPENFQPSLTMTKSNVFSEGHDSYVYDSLRSKLEITTAPKDSFDKTQSYSNHVISSHIPELIDSYSSSSTLEIPENIYFSKSLLPLTSLKNLISTSLTPEVIYSNPFLPNSIQFDDPKFSLYSLEIIEISSMIDQFTQELPLITPPVFGNTIESNFKYSPTTSTSSQSSDFISSTENGNTSILASSYSSNSVNPVYDSSMINVAVTNFTMHNSLVSTLHSDIDYQLESIYSSSESVYLYSSQIPLFVLSSFISEDKESNHLIPEFSYLYSSQTSMLVSSSFISEDNSNPKSSSNISNSSLFTSSNLTLSSKQMATLLISNYTLASINTNTSTKQESLNNNNSETKRISNLLTATESSSMQKTEFYVSTSSVLEMSSRNMQLNNSLYFQHFWIVTNYDEKPLKFGNFDQNMEKSKNNEDVSSSCYVNLPPIPSHISLVATKPKFDKACCERRQNLQQQELQMQQDLSPNELYINLNAECEEIGCAECNRSNYTRKNKRKVFKQRKCNLRHASDVNSFKESSLNELYDDDKLWRRQPDTLQQTCVKMHNLLDDAFQLISMNLPQQNLKPFMSQSFHEPNHEMQHVPKYSQYQQCKCAPQLGYSRYNISPSWNKAGDELSKISSDEAWIPFMAPNKDCFDHKHSQKPLMHSTQHFPENHKEKNLIPGINNFCCSTQSSTYYFPHLSNSTSYSAARHQLCPHRQVATSLDISTNQLRTIGSKIPNFSSKNSNKISTVQQFSRFSPQTSSSNQSFLRQKISQKATDDEIDAIYKNIKPNTSQPLIQSIREELMTASAYNNEINSFNILE